MSNGPTPRDRIKALIIGAAEEIWGRIMDASVKFRTLDVIEDAADLLKDLDLSNEEAVRKAIADFESQGALEPRASPYEPDNGWTPARNLAVFVLRRQLRTGNDSE